MCHWREKGRATPVIFVENNAALITGNQSGLNEEIQNGGLRGFETVRVHLTFVFLKNGRSTDSVSCERVFSLPEALVYVCSFSISLRLSLVLPEVRQLVTCTSGR